MRWSKHPGIVLSKKKNISEGASFFTRATHWKLCSTLLKPPCTQAVKNLPRFWDLQSQSYQRTVTNKRTDEIIKKFWSWIAFQKQKHLEIVVWKTHSSSASKYLFLWKSIFLLPRLTGWQYCILKTNISNDCCRRCNCADFIFLFFYFLL